jgi:hypothetical protein
MAPFQFENTIEYFDSVAFTLVPEVYFYYFPCEGERKNKPLEPGYVAFHAI